MALGMIGIAMPKRTRRRQSGEQSRERRRPTTTGHSICEHFHAARRLTQSSVILVNIAKRGKTGMRCHRTSTAMQRVAAKNERGPGEPFRVRCAPFEGHAHGGNRDR